MRPQPRLPTTSVEQTLFIANDLPEFFYYFIWKYPALAISAGTASRPNADALNRKRLFEFNEFDEQLLIETEALTKQARSLELLPELGETISEDSEKRYPFPGCNTIWNCELAEVLR